jgi:hypothetical protein
MKRERQFLFSDEHLTDYLRKQQEQMLAEVNGLSSDYLLKVSVDDLADHLANKYRVEPVVLSDTPEIGEHGETQADVSQDQMRFIRDRSRPHLVKATFATLVIPYKGDPHIFHCHPSSEFIIAPPTGEVKGQEVHVRLTRQDLNSAAMKADFEGILENLRKQVDLGAPGIHAFNAGLRQQAKERLATRKSKFLADQGMVAALGFPVRPRAGAAVTYSAAVARKKLPIQKPTVTAGLFKPEPVLEMEHYEHILSVISNMAQTMERSPKSFVGLNEEDLRMHFLVPLNAQYEGQATGETFNASGKTDILIRAEGKTIFIAECKFWKGAEVFKQTIDQLLGYAAWRDTKTAIIVFNRNKDTSAVVEQIPVLVKGHPNFKREATGYKTETGSRFVLHHRDDKNRELTLTVLVFDVPS